MRDWASTLRRASFRGVSFWVEYEDLSGGKRLARHEYAGGRRTRMEEMGLKTPSFSVTAYLLGDTSDVSAALLSSACLAAGPGRLVLPMDAGQLAYVEDFHRSRERDRRGYVAFEFTAVPASGEVLASLSLADVDTTFLGTLSVAASAFGRFF
ncbi:MULTISPECIES: DNA circularization N-terminal domain-containing protein [unclassified Agrobacterium]|uniref:DNA circularization N-terminal domain-containing protein n=1 Tax=unclassified Agrobacterium TaxID=2632611 RepID=UPI00244A209B|nr:MULTISPECIES: DNA circularization N-terminal domain-containing protein [unclassified Agrobacterium]MDH0615930.1 DNA circularization N-terminal domain-containing protein [Agrobacterium sp. GD03872]MDH0698045.1 DNA circularization N-terminal domain-containing protein [Agrobacterium sp. GD03871]MDH1061130.1 DNA circularization N-terminal domain-containing protein [Agrobacterium sp. GD03992]MDH2211838.1 DNA circularization N-terminal domain-containing protein [Agrobacterium sp. GD03643]MDH22212